MEADALAVPELRAILPRRLVLRERVRSSVRPLRLTEMDTKARVRKRPGRCRGVHDLSFTQEFIPKHRLIHRPLKIPRRPT